MANEADQFEQGGEEMWVEASETLGMGWSFIQRVPAPQQENLLTGPSPSITDTTAQDLLNPTGTRGSKNSGCVVGELSGSWADGTKLVGTISVTPLTKSRQTVG